jgi:hypothetical protein
MQNDAYRMADPQEEDAGEPGERCRECGGQLAFHAEYADSGVRGPCGERELKWQEWYECLACGAVEGE